MIEDTSFVIDLLQEDPDAVEYLHRIENANRPEKLAAITVLELYEAVPQLRIPERRQQNILEDLDTRHVITADTAVNG
jgi:uncharacterized protein with PIN domain